MMCCIVLLCVVCVNASLFVFRFWLVRKYQMCSPRCVPIKMFSPAGVAKQPGPDTPVLDDSLHLPGPKPSMALIVNKM